MASSKISVFSRFSGRFVYLVHKVDFSRFHPKWTKVSKFYGDFRPSVHSPKEIIPFEPKRTVRTDSNLRKSLKSFKERLARCVDPVMQYDLLMELQRSDPNMYYQFIQANTSMALAILCKAECITNPFEDHLSARVHDNFLHKMRELQRMEFGNAIAHLQKRIDEHRQKKQTSKTDMGFQLSESPTPTPIDKKQAVPLKKGLLTTPKISFMIYLKPNKKD